VPLPRRSLAVALALFAVVPGSRSPAEDAPPIDADFERAVFVAGEDGYASYRIPAIIASPKGSLLAFCEGRVNGRSDTGNIDLVLKRSDDGGRTWSKLEVVWNDAANTCGNPAPVVDASTGRIWLPMTWNHGEDNEQEIGSRTGKDTRRVFVTHSDDDGRTWDTPREITESTKNPDWTWYATGPGNSIQLRHGEHAGRLVVPCDFKTLVDGETRYHSHCIYSDDHGETWHLGEPTDQRTNESTVVELPDGRLLLNMRSYAGKNRRAITHSSDGGHSWSPVTFDETLIEPVCQANLVRLDAADETLLAFSNPASTKREKMTVRISRDLGRTWPVARLVYGGSAAYSNLVPLEDGGQLGLLYERDGYGRITFTRFAVPE
jgi:sialidase-1